MSARGPYPVENRFVGLALALAVLAWLAVILADLGALAIWLFGSLGTIAVVGVFTGLRGTSSTNLGELDQASPDSSAIVVSKSDESGVSRPGTSGARLARPVPTKGSVLGLVVVAAASAILFFPPFEPFLAAGDASVHLNLAPAIARNRGYTLRDPLLAETPEPLRRELFRNRTVGDAGGAFVRLPGGFGIPDISEPLVATGFSPVLPAAHAVVFSLFGIRAITLVAPLAATLSVVGLFVLGYTAWGRGVGLVSALWVAVSMPQIWFAKLPLSEIVAQFFVVAAFVGLSLALRTRSRRLAFAGGLLLGMAALTRVELIPIVVTAMASFIAIRALVSGTWPDPLWTWAAAGTALPVFHGCIHYLATPTHYTAYFRQHFETSYAGRIVAAVGVAEAAATLLLAAALGLVLLRNLGSGPRGTLRKPRLWGGIGLATVTLYFVNYLSAAGNRPAEFIDWLGWYLSWPMLLTFMLAVIARPLIGAFMDVDRKPTTSNDALLLFALVLIVVASAHYMKDPQGTGAQILSMRRFVPVVIPLLIISTVALSSRVLRRFPQHPRNELAIIGCVALAALIFAPSRALLGTRLWRGAFEEAESISGSMPRGSIGVVAGQLSGTHLATTLNYVHEIPSLVASPLIQGATLGDAIDRWLANGRHVFLIVGEQPFSFFAPHLSTIDVDHRVLELRVLETTYNRVPQQVVTQSTAIDVFRLQRVTSPRSVVNIGDPGVDSLYRLRGFHSHEKELAAGSAAFRWTTGHASMLVPRSARLTLVLSGARPDGIPAARVEILVDDALLRELEVPNEAVEISLELDELDGAAPREVRIRSTTFVPSAAGLSTDNRQLGVRLYEVQLAPVAPGDEAH